MNSEREVVNLTWYRKYFQYLNNRNRVCPSQVELPDCDFFTVGSRRTLRILRPVSNSEKLYESFNNKRPNDSTINDNFFSRWTERPHSSENCRCSFRQSNRFSINQKDIITAEINRIRLSLCQMEKTRRNIEEIEKRVSLKLHNSKFMNDNTNIENGQISETNGKIRKVNIDEKVVKNKIVRDLERYINDLLEEIMSDTMKFISGTENDLLYKKKFPEKIEYRDTINNNEHQNVKTSEMETLKIKFAFPGEKSQTSIFQSIPTGYVNSAFEGTVQDPDCLDFYLIRRHNAQEIIHKQLDCLDSGINSVETVELQQDQEPSLEETILEIMDAKLARSKSLEALDETSVSLEMEKTSEKESEDDSVLIEEDQEIREESDTKEREREKERSKEGDRNKDEERDKDGQGNKERERNKDGENLDDVEERNVQSDENDKTEELTNNHDSKNFISDDFGNIDDVLDNQNFKRLRLEFRESTSTPKVRTRRISVIREKLFDHLSRSNKNRNWIKRGSSKTNDFHEDKPLEMKDYRKRWSEVEVPSPIPYQEPDESIFYQKHRKPIIVFLHGFGSSADIFQYQLKYFSNLGYSCIAPDMLGHGLSSTPKRNRDYTFDKLLKDLELILHHYAFSLGQNCILVAHNYGCSFAAALACKYSKSIDQLVLISGGGPTPLAPPNNENLGYCFARTILTPFLICGLKREILYSARGCQHPYCGFESKEEWPSHMHYVLNGMVWPEGDYVLHRRICTPTLLIHGLRDDKVSLVQECQMERTMIKAFLEVLPNSGHIPMTDSPDKLNHMIHCFIDLWKNRKW